MTNTYSEESCALFDGGPAHLPPKECFSVMRSRHAASVCVLPYEMEIFREVELDEKGIEHIAALSVAESGKGISVRSS